MDQYRTSGVLDEDAYRETSWFWISRKRIWFIRIFAVIMGLFAILMMIVRDYLCGSVFDIYSPVCYGPLAAAKTLFAPYSQTHP